MHTHIIRSTTTSQILFNRWLQTEIEADILARHFREPALGEQQFQVPSKRMQMQIETYFLF
jgi:hypothetical protein